MCRLPGRALLVVLLLSACASPSPEFFGATKTAVTIDGRDFTVFRRDNRVQVIRHGYATPAEQRGIPELMLRAVAEATGCRPLGDSFIGDSGERRGRISC